MTPQPLERARSTGSRGLATLARDDGRLATRLRYGTDLNELRRTRRQIADPCAGRHSDAARHSVRERRGSRQGRRGDRPLRGQGAGADGKTRQGRRHQARQHAGRSRAGGRGKSSACASAITSVERLLVEEQAKIVREFYVAVLHDTDAAQAADPVLHRRRHGHRGDRGGKADRRSAGCWSTSTMCRRPTILPACSQGLDLGAAEAQVADILHKLYARLSRARRRASRNQSAGAARPTAAWSRSTANSCSTMRRSIVRRDIAAGGAAAADDRPGTARRRGRPQAHPARRQCRRARERRRADHDDHGRDPPLRRQAGELPRDRRRGLYQVGDRARPGAVQSGREKPGHQFLRRLCPHRRDGRGRGEGLAQAQAERAGVLLHPRHRRGRSGGAGAGALGIEPYDFMEDAIQAAVQAAQ